MSKHWVKHGHEVTVITTIYDKSDLKQEKFFETHVIDGIKVAAFNIRMSNKDPIWKRMWHFFFFTLAAQWTTLKSDSDVIVASSGPITVGILALVAKLLKNSRFFFEVRDLWPEGAIELKVVNSSLLINGGKVLAKLCYSHSEGIVALSSGMKSHIERNYRHSPITVAPNACDIDFFTAHAPSDRDPQPRTIVYAGTLGVMDDCSIIIEAARVARDRGLTHLRFALLGDGNERQKLEDLSARYNLENVSFLGLQPKAKVAEALGNALCSVYTIKDTPVLRTGSPNKLFDSLASSTPVIHNSGGWIKELTDSESCGFYFASNSPEKLVEHAERLYRNPSLLRQMQRNARRVAETRFNRQDIANRMLTFITARPHPDVL